MPRSSYIYVVIHPYPGCSYRHLIAAFTVKHELVDWWKRYDGSYQDEFEVWRICAKDQSKSIMLRGELE